MSRYKHTMNQKLAGKDPIEILTNPKEENSEDLLEALKLAGLYYLPLAK